MSSEKTLDMFKCCSSNDINKHNVMTSIAMPCDHSMCNKCLTDDDSNNKFIICQICMQIINQNDLQKTSQNNDSIQMKNFIDFNLNKFVDDLKAQYKTALANLKENMKNLHEKIEANVEFIKEEITIRVESIKIELDELNDKLKAELDQTKYDLMNRANQINIDEFEKTLNKLVVEEANHDNQIANNILEFNKQLQSINKGIDTLKNFNHQITVKISEAKVDENLIGEIDYIYKNQYSKQDLHNRIKSGEQTKIDFNAYDICLASNDNLIATNFNDANISLYDKNFKFIKSINKLNNLSFKPYSITANINENRYYICDQVNNRIFMIDSDLNYSNLFGGKCGSLNDQFDSPLGIYFYKKFLYICDSRNKRIQRLTSNLTFSSTYSLAYLPWQIKIANQLACIRDLFNRHIYFHDVNTFQIKTKYSGHNGFISLINTNFYEYYYENKVLYCYDQDGKLCDEIQTNAFDNTQFHSWSSILMVNNQFIMTAQPAKKLIII